MFALIGPDDVTDPWVGIVIPHELTHLVFDTAVDNPYHFPPRWLNEGVADVPVARATRRRIAAPSRRRPRRRPAHARCERLGGQFPTTRRAVLPGLRGERVGRRLPRPRRTARTRSSRSSSSYADGVTDDEAFTAAVGVDLAGFERAWLDDLGAAVPTRARAAARAGRAAARRLDRSPAAVARDRAPRRGPPRRIADRRPRRRRPIADAPGSPLGEPLRASPSSRSPGSARRRRARLRPPSPPRRPTARPAMSSARRRVRALPTLAGHPRSWRSSPSASSSRPSSRAEGPRVRYTTQERAPLVETVARAAGRSRTPSRSRSSTLRAQIGRVEGGDARQRRSSSRQLNDRARRGPGRGRPHRPRGAGHRPPARGLAGPRAGRTPRRPTTASRPATSASVVEELWLAGAEAIAVNGERIVPSTADPRHRRVASSSTRPTWRRRTRSRRSGRPTCTTCWPRRPGSSTSSASAAERVRHPASRSPSRSRWSCRPTPARRHPALRPAPGAQPGASRCRDAPAPQPDRHRRRRPGPRVPGRRPAPRPAGRHRARGAVVAGPHPARRQPQRPQRPAAARGRDLERELDDDGRGQGARRDVARSAAGATCERVRVWAGLDPAAGPGRPDHRRRADRRRRRSPTSSTSCATRAPRRSPSTTSGVVAGTVVAGPAGALSIDNTALGDRITITAIGTPQTLTGALDARRRDRRAAPATYPDVAVEVTPVDALELAATERTLVPVLGKPRP